MHLATLEGGRDALPAVAAVRADTHVRALFLLRYPYFIALELPAEEPVKQTTESTSNPRFH